ncbi:hypothetical protein EDB81DRAFT_874906 [Dactylonectria macrodidyma]|uniref:Uncharacterized protein n=1 Tax=Dactylonectria macrodidyma TaxID=307937 RepID=A0A9P9FT05_9HYPO|nr:hypothetical protein EDB81DRAFT_874906 [Dactylonectria macrodidyma]
MLQIRSTKIGFTPLGLAARVAAAIVVVLYQSMHGRDPTRASSQSSSPDVGPAVKYIAVYFDE